MTRSVSLLSLGASARAQASAQIMAQNRASFSIATLPPSTNALFANVPGKGRVKTEAYRTWLMAAGWQVKGQPRVCGQVALDIVCERKTDRRKRDLSNYVKAIEDLLVMHLVIEDDSLVTELHIRYGDVKGCEITVRAV